MAGTTRNILAMAWLAVTGLVSVQSELVSPPAQAQAGESLDANTCLSGRQVGNSYVFGNVCSQPIVVKYCTKTPYQDCQKETHFVATPVAANSSMTIYPPVETTSLANYACTAREEHYWLKADAFFGVEGRYSCRPNAATMAEFQLKSEVWRARPVQLSSPRTANCTAVINHGALGLDADGSSFIQERLGGRVSRIQWSGACDVDGLISGRGTLSITVFDSFETWVMVFIGTADRGLLVGDAGYGRDNGQDEVQAKPIFFNSGCNNWNGARPNTCDPAAGLVERQRYLAASAASAPSTAVVGTPDPQDANAFYKAADQGNAQAQFNLGDMYDVGRGVPQNYADAIRWYRMAADQGLASAQFKLGGMYEDGRGVPQNYTEAMRWYRMAADQGNATAQTILGSMYGNTFRDVQVVPQNYAEAVRWYRMAADQGNSQGQLSLGYRYLHGEGVPTNYVEAYKWFALSAAQGNVVAGTPRDFVLGKMTPAQIAEGQRLVAAWRPS